MKNLLFFILLLFLKQAFSQQYYALEGYYFYVPTKIDVVKDSYTNYNKVYDEVVGFYRDNSKPNIYLQVCDFRAPYATCGDLINNRPQHFFNGKTIEKTVYAMGDTLSYYGKWYKKYHSKERLSYSHVYLRHESKNSYKNKIVTLFKGILDSIDVELKVYEGFDLEKAENLDVYSLVVNGEIEIRFNSLVYNRDSKSLIIRSEYKVVPDFGMLLVEIEKDMKSVKVTSTFSKDLLRALQDFKSKKIKNNLLPKSE